MTAVREYAKAAWISDDLWWVTGGFDNYRGESLNSTELYNASTKMGCNSIGIFSSPRICPRTSPTPKSCFKIVRHVSTWRALVLKTCPHPKL